jgi:hypothetical protein
MRSGSTLQYQLTTHLIEEKKLGKRVPWVPPENFPELKDHLRGYEGWKVFKTHKLTEEIANEFSQNNAVGVFIYRDLRDAFVSIMRKKETSFRKIYSGNFLNANVKNFYKWTGLPKILVSKYETVIMDLPNEVQRIAEHLNISVTKKECEQIASKYNIEKQLKRIEKLKNKENVEFDLTNRGTRFDIHSNLHEDHIVSGIPGEYTDVLSERQIRKIEKLIGNWLDENGYDLLSSNRRTRFPSKCSQ